MRERWLWSGGFLWGLHVIWGVILVVVGLRGVMSSAVRLKVVGLKIIGLKVIIGLEVGLVVGICIR